MARDQGGNSDGKQPRKRRSGNPNPKTDHLRKYRFKKGQSGNPNGRPRGRSLQAMIRVVLEEEIIEKGSGKTMSKLEAVARVVVAETILKRPYMVREFLKREWPEIIRAELTGPGGDPLEVRTIDDPDRIANILEILAGSGVVPLAPPAPGAGPNGHTPPAGTDPASTD